VLSFKPFRYLEEQQDFKLLERLPFRAATTKMILAFIVAVVEVKTSATVIIGEQSSIAIVFVL
jgi:hypothetical protein